jgi:hypothetical protein
MKFKWWKLARRGAMAAIIACCVVGLTGCDEDEENGDGTSSGVVGTWLVTGGAIEFELYSDLSVTGLWLDADEDDPDISGSYEVNGSSVVIYATRIYTDESGESITQVTTLTGVVSGDTISGTFSETENGDATMTNVSWSATRQ